MHALAGIDHDAADLAGTRPHDLDLGALRQARHTGFRQHDARRVSDVWNHSFSRPALTKAPTNSAAQINTTAPTT